MWQTDPTRKKETSKKRSIEGNSHDFKYCKYYREQRHHYFCKHGTNVCKWYKADSTPAKTTKTKAERTNYIQMLLEQNKKLQNYIFYF